jgi:hypothetical protein
MASTLCCRGGHDRFRDVVDIGSKVSIFSGEMIIGHYERGGEIKIGDTALDSPSDREVARRERMKREN